jgi:hypothetical protein
MARVTYFIEFWRGAERILEYEREAYDSPEEARQYIEDLVREMMSDSTDDWTGCYFAVARSDGATVLQVPVLATMSAIARRTYN